MLIDAFELTSGDADQKHICLVHEVMREPVSLLQQRFEGDKLPVPYVKFLVKFLLEGLEYLHDTCHVIHSGIFFLGIMPCPLSHCILV